MRRLIVAGLVVTSLVTGCSSSGSGKADRTTTPPATGVPTDAAAANYVAAVNALCDALLPKVMAVMNGGHATVYPVAQFFKETPAHLRLLADFDKQLAAIIVPTSAKPQQAALNAYIRFANDIDRKRMAAAKNGQAAFDVELRAENVEFLSDPIAAARAAAGFSDSCNAR